MSKTNKDLKGVIREVLADHFENIVIVSVKVEPDFDEDGDPILLVEVVFDGKARRLDPDKTSSVLRRLRPRIADFGGAFPVISYIAKSELSKAKTAPA